MTTAVILGFWMKQNGRSNGRHTEGEGRGGLVDGNFGEEGGDGESRAGEGGELASREVKIRKIDS